MKTLIAAGAIAVAALAGCSNASDESSPPQSPAQETLTQPVEATAPAAPVDIVLPDGSETRIESVATDNSGVLNPPTDIGVVGWWVDSAMPGDPGTTVITGHVNSVDQGDGFADRFTDLKPGDDIRVITTDGAVTYDVEGITFNSKASEFPAEELNSLEGEHKLALITCGGEFVGPPWGYEDNVIVWAVPQ